MPRTDRLSCSKIRVLYDAVGVPCNDFTQWGDIVEPYFRNLFFPTLGIFPEKRLRLATLESACFAARLDGTHKALHLLLSVVHESRFRVLPGKQGGSDGLVGEMLKLVDWLALGRIRFAFEQRLNCASGYCDPMADWDSILVHCIPKTHIACHLKLYRPISLVSCMAKWYLSCLVFMLRSHTTGHTCSIYGFEPGRQCAEVTELLRMLLQKCEEWSLPLFIGRGDIAKAFDHVEHPVLDEALAKRGAPTCLRAAILRELINITLRINLQGSQTNSVPLGRGGKQGGSETPTLWNYLLDHILAPVVNDWSRKRYGVDLHDGFVPLSHAIWADDICWITTDLGELITMAQDLSYGLSDGGLLWKPDSLTFLANRTALSLHPSLPPSFPTLDRAAFPCWFHGVSHLPVLGVLLDGTGDTMCAVEHRLVSSQQHFFVRRTQLTCPRISVRRRVNRLYTTVHKSLLVCPGGWTLSKSLFHRCEGFESTLLRRVLAKPRKENEDFLTFLRRTIRLGRELLAQCSQTPLAVGILHAVHGWAGHVARMPVDSPLGRVLRFRNLRWWRATQSVMGNRDPRGVTGWRHSRPGRFARWEECLEALDFDWINLAQGRIRWQTPGLFRVHQFEYVRVQECLVPFLRSLSPLFSLGSPSSGSSLGSPPPPSFSPSLPFLSLLLLFLLGSDSLGLRPFETTRRRSCLVLLL